MLLQAALSSSPSQWDLANGSHWQEVREETGETGIYFLAPSCMVVVIC